EPVGDALPLFAEAAEPGRAFGTPRGGGGRSESRLLEAPDDASVCLFQGLGVADELLELELRRLERSTLDLDALGSTRAEAGRLPHLAAKVRDPDPEFGLLGACPPPPLVAAHET